jgi:hypothetical protein
VEGQFLRKIAISFKRYWEVGVDASVRIEGGTSKGREREQEIVLAPMEFIARIAALVPRPRQYRYPYYGVMASDAPQRGQSAPEL